MSSKQGFIDYIIEQLGDIGETRYKKMFGEYMVYLNDKPIFLICDDTVFVKIKEETTAFLGEDNPRGYPYDGASEHYVIDNLDESVYLQSLARILEKITPLPKKKVKK